MAALSGRDNPQCVHWYCKYGISYRDLEEMMEERGVDVDHTTIYRWVQHYAPEMEKRLGGVCALQTYANAEGTRGYSCWLSGKTLGTTTSQQCVQCVE